MTIAFILFLVSLVLAIPLRTWEYITVIDKETGFFNEYTFSVWALLAVILFAVIVMAITVFRDKNTMDYPYRHGTKGLGIIFLLLAVVSVLSGLGQTWTLPGAESASSGTILLYLLALVSVILGIGFLIGKTQTSFMRLMLLTPVLWVLVKMWSIYLGEKPILTVSQHLMELMGYVSLVLFLMAFASTVSGFAMEKHNRRVVYFGFLASLLLVSVSLPQMIMLFIGEDPVTTVNLLPLLLDLMWGILAGVAPVYICFGVDPLLDYRVLYENESAEEDPLAPETNQVPLGPAVPSPDSELHSGFTTLMQGIDGSMWERNVPMQADSVDEGYRYAYDKLIDDDEDLTAKKIIVPERAFYTNPNFQDVQYQDLFNDPTQEVSLPTEEDKKRIAPIETGEAEGGTKRNPTDENN